METLVFNSSMSILVHGSPIEDFQQRRGFRQGGHISLILFLIATEDLASLIHNACRLNAFQGFQVNEDIHFELMQFTYDTVIIFDGPWNNLCNLKAILRGLEMDLGLCVNLSKSKLIGINLKDDFYKLPHLSSLEQNLFHSIFLGKCGCKLCSTDTFEKNCVCVLVCVAHLHRHL